LTAAVAKLGRQNHSGRALAVSQAHYEDEGL